MKHLKDGALSYLFYLVGTFIFLIAVMTLDGSMTSPFSIRLSNILNYIDLGSLVFILAFCLLALACTKTMRPLKDAFVFMFQEQDYTVQQLSEYLLSIKVAAFAALTGGGMSFVVQIIKMLKSMDSDDAADIMENLSDEKRKEIGTFLDDEAKNDIRLIN